MTILNPDHLFDQAEKLVAPPQSGSLRQVDVRRAISSAYYGLFHYTLACLADEFVGVTKRATARYVLVYRSVDHRTLKEICAETRKQSPPQRYSPYLPANGFGTHIRAFATAALELQDQRHQADYNPEPRLRALEARLAIGTARHAVMQFERADQEHRKTFLTLLLCPPR